MSAFEDLFKTLRTERGVNRDSIITAIQAALLSAYATSAPPGHAAYARAIFDPATGSMTVQRLRDLHSGDLPRPGIDVVDGPNGKEIAVVDWASLPEEESETIELDGDRFGRVAAMAAKDALHREMRGSEQHLVYARYHDQIGQLVVGTVGERLTSGLLVALEDAEAIIPASERLPQQQPRPGDRIAALIVAVAEQSSGAQVTLSQTDARLVNAIFASEIADVKDGRVELVRVARAPGVRSKVAVANRGGERHQASAVGICVGERGSRIRLIRDLLGEDVDLLAYDPDPLAFVASALAPAKVRRVEKSGEGYVAIVSEDERARVAGPDGQGLRLAVELVGAPIELRVETAESIESSADDAPEGTCAYIRPNGRRCVNLAEPGSRFCGLPAHQAAGA